MQAESLTETTIYKLPMLAGVVQYFTKGTYQAQRTHHYWIKGEIFFPVLIPQPFEMEKANWALGYRLFYQ